MAFRQIDYYTDTQHDETIALKSATYETTIAKEKDDHGTTVADIETTFNTENKKYALVLKAAKVNSYWKLLSWIEVEKRRY
jgi:hypothetical protein